MGAAATSAQALQPTTPPPPAATPQIRIAQLADSAARLARQVAREILLADGYTTPTPVRARAAAAISPAWADLTGRMATLEGLAPNAFNAGWLADQELMDMAEAIRPGLPGDRAQAPAFLLDLAELLDAAAHPGAGRQQVRYALESAFEAWPKACRRMARRQN